MFGNWPTYSWWSNSSQNSVKRLKLREVLDIEGKIEIDEENGCLVIKIIDKGKERVFVELKNTLEPIYEEKIKG